MSFNPYEQPYYIRDLLAWDDDPEPASEDVEVPFSWTGNAGQAATVTYGFDPMDTHEYGGRFSDGILNNEPTEFDASSKAMTRLAATRFSEYAKITLVEASATVQPQIAIFNFINIDNHPYGATELTTPIINQKITGADVYLHPDFQGRVEGQKGFWTILHELGHALGLSHPQSDAGGDDPDYDRDLTMMSYNPGDKAYGELDQDVGRHVITPMIDDIAALQYLYGMQTDPVKGRSGVTEYTYNPLATSYSHTVFTGNQGVRTIWDAGNTDTFNLINASDSVTLDLRGGFDTKFTSSLQDDQPNFSRVGDEYIALALDPRNASGVVDIEVAKGGASDDTLVGGYAANTLEGGGGADRLIEPFTGDEAVNYIYGGLGNDSIYGGANMQGQLGGDFIFGGPGVDTVWMNGGIATFENDGTGAGERFIGWTGSSSIRRSDANGTTDINGITVAVNPEGAFVEVAMGEIGASNTLRVGNVEIKGSFASPVYHTSYGNLWSLGNGWWIEGNSHQIIVRDATYREVAEIDEWESGDFGITLSDGQGPSSHLAAIGALPAADRPDFATPYLVKPREGTAGNDARQGTNLADNLVLLGGNDTSDGGHGNDTTNGGDGANSMAGGADVDRFVVALASAAYTDTITDFNASVGEIIDVSALGSNLTLAITQTGADASFTVGTRTVLMKNVNDNWPLLRGICTICTVNPFAPGGEKRYAQATQ